MDNIKIPVRIGHSHSMGVAFFVLILLGEKTCWFVERHKVMILIQDQFTYSFHALVLPLHDGQTRPVPAEVVLLAGEGNSDRTNRSPEEG